MSSKLLTIAAAAKWLDESERTTRRRIASGELRAYRVGKRAVRIKQEDLESLLRPIPTSVGRAV